jgi:hypothetical protein
VARAVPVEGHVRDLHLGATPGGELNPRKFRPVVLSFRGGETLGRCPVLEMAGISGRRDREGSTCQLAS